MFFEIEMFKIDVRLLLHAVKNEHSKYLRKKFFKLMEIELSNTFKRLYRHGDTDALKVSSYLKKIKYMNTNRWSHAKSLRETTFWSLKCLNETIIIIVVFYSDTIYNEGIQQYGYSFTIGIFIFWHTINGHTRTWIHFIPIMPHIKIKREKNSENRWNTSNRCGSDNVAHIILYMLVQSTKWSLNDYSQCIVHS